MTTIESISVTVSGKEPLKKLLNSTLKKSFNVPDCLLLKVERKAYRECKFFNCPISDDKVPPKLVSVKSLQNQLKMSKYLRF